MLSDSGTASHIKGQQRYCTALCVFSIYEIYDIIKLKGR